VWLIPCFSASPLVDQWVASGGAFSRVSTTIASTFSSLMVRAAPVRGASTSPSRRSPENRCRHFDTVTGWHPSAAAIELSVSPSAHPSTIRQSCGVVVSETGLESFFGTVLPHLAERQRRIVVGAMAEAIAGRGD